ncbi:hypothetical protein [Sphingobacterium litopenaei]|uniref:Transposase IS204/IS1001/IS1096/IS1165 DDE domain-containing protein n=1 Tax=Sphingobacterium litopenaei TaxID=2763500 RepID=A0ABR7YEI6_9SPHI|nr:hypothetical protein [Sphingobacterium litopenaei]
MEYVTRDRAPANARAIAKAIPEAKQIVYRFHLVKNLFSRDRLVPLLA